MIGTQFIKQQIDEGHLLLREIPLSPQKVQHIAELFFLFLCLNQFHSLRSAFASIAFSMLSGRVGKKSMPVILST